MLLVSALYSFYVTNKFLVIAVLFCSKTKLWDRSRKIWRTSRPEPTTRMYVLWLCFYCFYFLSS